jgi:hypothetical protein
MSKTTDGTFKKAKWGPWVYDPNTLELVAKMPRNWSSADRERAVSLANCRDSAGVLDEIAQIAKKAWAPPELVGGLVIALNDLISLQQNVCGGGHDKSIEPKKVIEQRRHLWSDE